MQALYTGMNSPATIPAGLAVSGCSGPLIRPRLTVVLCTTGARESLADALARVRRSLAAAGGADSWPVIVVHNAREAAPELEALCRTSKARYIHQPIQGLSVARNTGVLACDTEVIAFIDDDILVDESWAQAVMEGFSDLAVKVVTGPVLPANPDDPAGKLWSAYYRLPFDRATSFESHSDIPFFPLTVGFCGTGNNMAFRTSFLLTNGLFDAHFGLGSHLPGGEEIERFYAVVRDGGKIHFTPQARVEHGYVGGEHALRRKIRGYAAAQAGLLTKWFFGDPAMRGKILAFVWSRVTAVLRRGASDAPSGRVSPPRLPIILGTISGPLRYLVATTREAISPTKAPLAPPSAANGTPTVLMLPYNSGLGGAETVCHSLASTLRSRAGISVIVPEAGRLTAALRESGVSVGIAPRRRLRWAGNPFALVAYAARFPGTVSAYSRIITACSPDVVHIDSLLNIPALLAARRSGRCVLLHLQEVSHGLVRKLLAKVATRISHRVVAVSKAAVSPVRVAPGKLAVVHNGTYVPDLPFPYDPNGRISFIGRLAEDKDPVKFVRAASRVYREENRARFRICGITVPGRKGYDERLASEIAKSGIPADRLQLVRDCDNVQVVLRESSIVVSTSAVPESFGLSILEAMAQGRPVIVPASGAFPELIEDEETGLLYPPGNLDALVTAILRLLRDATLAHRIGATAHERVRKHFRNDQMADGMMEQYEICLGNSARIQTATGSGGSKLG